MMTNKHTMTTDNDLTFFIYCRKSSEDDRQAASIGDQLRELAPLVEHDKLDLGDEPLFKEEKSAKAPGRPIFNEMMTRIERGEANAIICWDIDRLYRNPIDEGRVRWSLQRGIIREIRTPHRVFYPQDAGLLMGVEGGRATDHIITLRKGVLRGMRGKLEKGHRPGVAPPGYLNDSSKEQGERDNVPDPDRFKLIRKSWDHMLTGRYSVRQIQKLAADSWGLRSRNTKKLGGKPYSLSTWYGILTNPFYYGYFSYTIPGTDARKLYKGAHQAMISREEFDRIQLLLGRKGKPVSQRHHVPFTGLIRCGECGAMVTADLKYQVICSQCKFKFSAFNRDSCPRCQTEIDRMQDPKRLYYTYYHCTKRKTPHCTQRSLRSNELERQLDRRLATISISEEYKQWAIEDLREQQKRESTSQSDIARSLDRRHNDLERQLAHIKAMILSPDTDWTLISREEVKEEKLTLLREVGKVKRQRALAHARAQESLELSERTFLFAAYARFWLREGDVEQQRVIATALGSNLVLKDKKLTLQLEKSLSCIAQMIDAVPAISDTFEPRKYRLDKRKSPRFTAGIPSLCRGSNAVRTYWETALDAKPLPVFPIPT